MYHHVARHDDGLKGKILRHYLMTAVPVFTATEEDGDLFQRFFRFLISFCVTRLGLRALVLKNPPPAALYSPSV